MRRIAALLTAALAMSGVALAQAPAPNLRDYEAGYIEAIAQSAFGNVTSQSFGVEGGVNVDTRIRAFAEVGLTRDTAPKTLGTAAQTIAGYLTQTQSAAVAYSVRQPVMFVGGGVRYMIPYDQKIEPYVLGGLGLARVKRDVGFTVGGTDVTSTLANYGVVLGGDLSGTASRLMITAGGGVMWNARKSVFVDFQYRFGRILDKPAGFNLNRVGGGVGVRF